MAQLHHDNTKSAHCRDVGALSLEPCHYQGMQHSYEMYTNPTWLFCQLNCTVVIPGNKNDKSYLFLPNASNGIVLHVFSFPSCIVVDNSGRLFHNLLRNHTGHQHMQNYAQSQLGWNRLPFLPKQWFKHNVLNTSCRVNDKDVDINLVSYRTKKKI